MELIKLNEIDLKSSTMKATDKRTQFLWLMVGSTASIFILLI